MHTLLHTNIHLFVFIKVLLRNQIKEKTPKSMKALFGQFWYMLIDCVVETEPDSIWYVTYFIVKSMLMLSCGIVNSKTGHVCIAVNVIAFVVVFIDNVCESIVRRKKIGDRQTIYLNFRPFQFMCWWLLVFIICTCRMRNATVTPVRRHKRTHEKPHK